MDQTSVILICICGLLALVIIVLLIKVLHRPKKGDHKVVIKGGVDIDSGKKGSDSGELFDGTHDPDGTLVVGRKQTAAFHVTLVNEATGESHSLRFRRMAGIGRVEDRNMEQFLTIRDPWVSHLQCCIYAKNGGLYLENRSRKNVTAVNGKRISDPHRLRSGDVIRIGNTRLKVKL